jgi:hypothetical protein
MVKRKLRLFGSVRLTPRAARGRPAGFPFGRSPTLCVVVRGETFERVRYGSEREDWGAARGPCDDCGVAKGELHIWGCDVERCPAYGGQVIYCECEN